MSDNKLKVVIPPEVLAQMERDIPADELQTLLTEFQRLVESGEIFEQSEPIDMTQLEHDDPELYAELKAAMQAQGFDSMDEWVEDTRLPPTLN